MANPALKNGYISIATELVEKLATIAIPSSEMRIVWIVWRKTWGWKEGARHKDWDFIALSQFEKLTLMKHSNVAQSLKSLVVKRLLLKSKNGYKFNQNYDEWVVVKRLPPPPASSQTTTDASSQTTTNNRKTKETNTIVGGADKVFVFKEELEKLRSSERKDHRIIAHYWLRKGWKFENRQQFSAALRRELRPAKALSGYSGEQVGLAIKHCQLKYSEWTLETVFKRIQDVIQNV